jgi:hypothetical protein
MGFDHFENGGGREVGVVVVRHLSGRHLYHCHLVFVYRHSFVAKYHEAGSEVYQREVTATPEATNKRCHVSRSHVLRNF